MKWNKRLVANDEKIVNDEPIMESLSMILVNDHARVGDLMELF